MKNKIAVKGAKAQKITPFLWFDHQAEEAAKFYVSIFNKNSKILKVVRYSKSGPGPEGTVMLVSFQLAGQNFTALNGGPQFTFSLATSFVVNCDTQKEVDWFWEKLSQGGEKSQCGWLKDKYGLSWQVVPSVIPKFMSDSDPLKSQRVMSAVLKMDKIEIEALKKAYKGVSS
jgi:predicted 3-demethylubiquinone-9 3-methyltransferase (glyoxalase superfamily)